ncbi:MAG: hypothetical protein ACP5NV_01985 [Candidatus Woesearchaeota archaeon]
MKKEFQKIPKNHIMRFLFDCAIHYVYNPSERARIDSIVSSEFKDYTPVYARYVLEGIIFRDMVNSRPSNNTYSTLKATPITIHYGKTFLNYEKSHNRMHH